VSDSNSTPATGLTPGWYAGDNGTQRYWTGTEWVSPVPPSGQRKKMSPKKRRNLLLAIIGLVVLALVGTGVAVGEKAAADQHAAVVHAQHVAAVKRAKAAAAAKKRQEAEQAAASQAAADNLERTTRKAEVKEMQASIKKSAAKAAADGLLDGPFSKVVCNTTEGSILDTAKTSQDFNCLAVDKTDADGTMHGYNYSAHIDWNSGEYSWKLGS
jgi:hypothetical protein